MGKIMEIPSPHLYYHTTYKDHKHSFMKGDKVLDMFYSQGIWKENYIPKELEDKHWIPDNEKYYEVWWDSTDPADPADPGHDYIEYIEEYKKPNVSEAAKLWGILIQKLENRSETDLKKIINFIDTSL